MRRAQRVLVLASAWCLLSAAFGQMGSAFAQPPQATAEDRPAGHSRHGDAFNEGPRQGAYLMPGVGAVDFAVTTKSPDAQKFFNQGVGQLHGFWYFEAERSFRQVLAIDPSCVMAYWGMAMANTENPSRAKKFTAIARERKGSVSPREQLWIDALSDYDAGADNSATRRQYVRNLERIVQEHPGDVDAKALLALQIWVNGSWMTDADKRVPISSHQAVDALLDDVFRASPMHPAHHYRIHLWDEEKPKRALRSAAVCGQAAPAVAHMWHMPAHTFSKLHRWGDAVWQQEAALRVDHAHMIRDRIMPDQIHNYAHNSEWLVRNLVKVGRARDAIAVARNLCELPRHPKHNMPDSDDGSAHFGPLRLVEVLSTYELWGELAALGGTFYLDNVSAAPGATSADRGSRQGHVVTQAVIASALARGDFVGGRAERGHERLAQLRSIVKEERARRHAAAEAAGKQGRVEKKPQAAVDRAVAEAVEKDSQQLERIVDLTAEVGVYALIAEKKHQDAAGEADKLKASKHVCREQLARALVEIGQNDRAVQLVKAVVADRPGEVCPLAAMVDVMHRAGNKTEAGKSLDRLRNVAAEADLTLPALERLKPIARELNLPEDWRVPPVKHDDVGQRPELAGMGPLRWQAAPAAQWSLADQHGREITLAQYQGKSVVLIFYLGFGCTHCVQQLHKFAPLVDQFADAGIHLIAISSETGESLRKSAQGGTGTPPVSFPVVSDAQLAVFKSYRAYDDFEQIPLHATVLIGPDGLVRWQDIGFEPFKDPQFLLMEAKRLLAQSR